MKTITQLTNATLTFCSQPSGFECKVYATNPFSALALRLSNDKPFIKENNIARFSTSAITNTSCLYPNSFCSPSLSITVKCFLNETYGVLNSFIKVNTKMLPKI